MAIFALREQREATVALLAGLDREQWADVVAGGWRVRTVAAWLAWVDRSAASGRLTALDSRSPLDVQGAASSDVDPQTALGEVAEAGERLTRAASRIPSAVWRIAPPHPRPTRSLLCLVRMRVLREWVANWDIATAVGREPQPPAAPVARVLVNEILERMPAELLPSVQRASGVLRILIEQAPGGGDQVVWGIDFARKHFGTRVDAPPDATIRLTAGALVLLAQNRAETASLDSRELDCSGDTALNEPFLAALSAWTGV